MSDDDQPSGMKSEQRARYEFKRALEELQDLKGSGTELVSVYIQPDRNIADVVNQLRDELGQAQNIKSKSTRKNVSSALEAILQRLKGFKTPPNNGLICLAGQVLVGRNKTEMVTEVIEPPKPVPINTYRCDSRFHLEPLEGMLDEDNTYGLLVVDRSEATIGFLRGERVEVVRNMQSHVPRKHRKGGQSQRRMERLIEEAAENFFKSVAESASEVFQTEENIQGILVGGPGNTKDQVVDAKTWHHEVKKHIMQTFDTGYTDEYGLKELVDNAHDTLEQLGLTREKDLVNQFLGEIRKPEMLASYGEEEVRRMLRMGAVETLILSESLRKVRVEVSCPNDHEQGDVTVPTIEKFDDDPPTCDECNAELEIEGKTDIVKELAQMADDTGAGVEFVSQESKEGEMFYSAFGGIGAILRFRA